MFADSSFSCPGVVPVLVGPLQVILTVLPGILLAMLGGMIRLFSPRGFANAARLLWRQKTAVLILGLAVAGTLYGCRNLLTGSKQHFDGSEAESGSDWTTARGGLLRTGAVFDDKQPDKHPSPIAFKMIWNFRSPDGFGFTASPAVVGNRVYISAWLVSIKKEGMIYCLDADTGALVWANAPDNYRPTFSSPVISGNYLVCGEGLHETRDARVVCLDIRPEAKGKVLWTFETRNHVECTPAIDKDRVYFGAGDDGIYCLALEPGEGNQARMIWHIPNTMYVGADGEQFKDKAEEYGLRNERFKEGVAVVFRTETKDGKEVPIVLRPLEAGENAQQAGADMKSGTIKKKDAANGVLTVVTPDGRDLELAVSEVPDAETSLAVHDGKVYFGLGNNGQAMCVIDAETGKELKRVAMPYPVFSPATIDKKNGKIYFGMGNGDYKDLGEGGAVHCLKLDTLEKVWDFPLASSVLGAVAAVEDQLYFCCGDGFLYCLSKDGQLVGKYNARAPIKTAPAVTTGKNKAVYIVTDRGLLIALDRKTLQPMWEYRLGAEVVLGNKVFFVSSPVVARGHVYVGTEHEGFFCLGEAVEKAYWPNPLGGLNKTGNDDDSFFHQKKEVHWTYPGDVDKAGCPVSIAIWKDEPVGGRSPEWWMVVPISTEKKTGLACLPRNAAAGAAPQPRWYFETGGTISQAPVVLDNLVLATVSYSKDTGRLLCLERDSGKLAWEWPIAASGVLTVTPPQRRLQILVQDKKVHLTSLDQNGKVQWSVPIGELGRQPEIGRHVHLYPMAAANIIVVATWAAAAELGLEGKPALLALDRGTGTVLWKVPLPAAPHTSPYLASKTIYLGTPTGLEARSLLDGRLLPGWDCQAGPPSAEFAVGEKSIVYVNKAGEVVFVNRDDGVVKDRVEGALPGFPPLVSRETAMVVTPQGLSLASFRQGDGQLILRPWLNTTALGPTAAPLVLSDSRLYLPTLNMGLVCIGGKK